MYSSARTRIKICCIASLEEAQLAVSMGADAVGFVCATPTSVRTINKGKVAQITPRIPPPIGTFLLTSESKASNIAENVRLTSASTVQILYHLSIGESERLSELLPTTKRVQVIHVESEKSLDLIDKYSPYINAFLLDSGRPNLETPEYGGTGRTHDWAISGEFVRRSPLPVFLAGGLTNENVAEAIKVVRPFAVDLCSGVRTNAHLDSNKLKAFISEVRRIDFELLNDSNT
ncbi:MAG: phosphoribosylanthranilate isomerase [Bacteroidota bacterium]